MGDLAGYLCWTPDSAASRISTEAVIPSSSLFLATHTPLRISRARLVQRGLVESGDFVDEHVVLEEFTNRKADSGALMMPLVGESGSGKSHLVRWVREHLKPATNQKVIYLEKTQTSLKAVVTALLSDVEDTSLDSLKREVSSFSVQIDPAALARKIVNSLNEALANTKPAGLPALERGLVGPNGLALLLQDPLFQGYLLQPKGFIAQLAEQLLRDRGSESSERSRGFTAEDLPLKVKDVNSAAAKSKRLVGMINTMPGLKDAAIGLLNSHLEAALRSAANLAAGRLTDAFLKVRKVYATQGREILLLIEDFALIQGVQGELLDALTEPAVREGEVRLAPIRTLMAVTTGYFTDLLPETALTRIGAASGGHVFRLDVTFGRSEDEAAQIASFTGRYLNVARIDGTTQDLGEQELTKNRCDTCAYSVECHERFGTSPEGYGLYPFNQSALVRMVHSTADKPNSFVPRTVLGKVVRPVLIEHARSIEGGTFPDESARLRFPRAMEDAALATEVSSVIETEDESDVDRYKFVLEFWGNAPSSLQRMDAGLLRTFRLRPITTVTPNPGQPDPEKPPGSGGPVTRGPAVNPGPPLSPKWQWKIDAIELWAGRGEQLDQRVANDLRKIIIEAVQRRFLWIDPLMREWTKTPIGKAWPTGSRTVSIEDAYGEKIGESAPIRFERKAVTSQFFQGLVRLQNAGRTRAVDLRRLASIAESGGSHFAAAVQRYGNISDDHLVTGMRATLLGGVLAGRAWPGMREPDLLAVVFDEGREWTRTDSDSRTAVWNESLERHRAGRPEMVQVLRGNLGVAQGTGEIRMIDAARALPLLKRAVSEWQWRPETTPNWLQGVTGFSNLDAWVTAQIAALRSMLERIRDFLPERTSGPETVEAVRVALDEAPRVGLGPTSREEDSRLRDLIRKAQEVDWRAVGVLANDLVRLEDATMTDDKRYASALRVAAVDRGPSLGVILEFLTAADRWLSVKLPEAKNRISTAGDAAVRAVQGALTTWSAIGTEDA
ncbi:protein DpdH [Saccharothrix luteola]|uniref:protein DpdH n=1 Tax=Saccharothrix luteola TaxID=2893018 RepID=UPI001E285249|nr:protein DpdH [Saccharothrix luteola]MCC8244087.1 ATP-binding protein [Saccharothrix luteola]